MDSLSIFILFIDEACIFCYPREYPFHFFLKISVNFLSLLQPGVASEGWVHVQSKIIDQSSPRVICIHTTLHGNKSFYLPTHALSTVLNVYHLCHRNGVSV